MEGPAEGTLQRCDQREGSGARHGGGPGHRSHAERQSTGTGQREERAAAENPSFSSSARHPVNWTGRRLHISFLIFFFTQNSNSKL